VLSEKVHVLVFYTLLRVHISPPHSDFEAYVLHVSLGQNKLYQKCIRDISRDCLLNPQNRIIKTHLKSSGSDFVDYIHLAENMIL